MSSNKKASYSKDGYHIMGNNYPITREGAVKLRDRKQAALERGAFADNDELENFVKSLLEDTNAAISDGDADQNDRKIKRGGK